MTQLRNILKIFISWLLLQVVVVFSENESFTERRTDARIEDVPFLVKILLDGKFACDGSLVTDVRVITASSCVAGLEPHRLTVVAGTSELYGAGVERNVYAFVSYPEYDENSIYHSVAVLHLESRYTGPVIRPSSKCDVTTISPGDEVQLFGWYLYSKNSSSPSEQLQTLTVRVVDQADCQSKYGTSVEINQNMFCIGEPGISACQIEMGAPAVMNGEICGIITLGVYCQYGDYPVGVVSFNKILPFVYNALTP